MSSPPLYGLLADLILIIHFAFVLFVVVGFGLILVGLLAGWRWVGNRPFRVTHLVAIAVVVIQAWLGQLCPLTIWENQLRRMAGQTSYSESFIQHWLHKVLFYQAEPWMFTASYTAFAALVVLVWLLERR